MLVAKLRLTPGKSGGLLLSLYSDQNQGLDIQLGPPLVHGFCDLLVKSSNQAGWGLSLGLVPQIAHTSRSSEIVRALVSSGFGFSLLNVRPLGYSHDESPYRVLPLRGDHRHPDFGIVTMAETEQPTIVQAFIENCLDLRQEGAFASLIVE